MVRRTFLSSCTLLEFVRLAIQYLHRDGGLFCHSPRYWNLSGWQPDFSVLPNIGQLLINNRQ